MKLVFNYKLIFYFNNLKCTSRSDSFFLNKLKLANFNCSYLIFIIRKKSTFSLKKNGLLYLIFNQETQLVPMLKTIDTDIDLGTIYMTNQSYSIYDIIIDEYDWLWFKKQIKIQNSNEFIINGNLLIDILEGSIFDINNINFLYKPLEFGFTSNIIGSLYEILINKFYLIDWEINYIYDLPNFYEIYKQTIYYSWTLKLIELTNNNLFIQEYMNKNKVLKYLYYYIYNLNLNKNVNNWTTKHTIEYFWFRIKYLFVDFFESFSESKLEELKAQEKRAKELQNEELSFWKKEDDDTEIDDDTEELSYEDNINYEYNFLKKQQTILYNRFENVFIEECYDINNLQNISDIDLYIEKKKNIDLSFFENFVDNDNDITFLKERSKKIDEHTLLKKQTLADILVKKINIISSNNINFFNKEDIYSFINYYYTLDKINEFLINKTYIFFEDTYNVLFEKFNKEIDIFWNDLYITLNNIDNYITQKLFFINRPSTYLKSELAFIHNKYTKEINKYDYNMIWFNAGIHIYGFNTYKFNNKDLIQPSSIIHCIYLLSINKLTYLKELNVLKKKIKFYLEIKHKFLNLPIIPNWYIERITKEYWANNNIYKILFIKFQESSELYSIFRFWNKFSKIHNWTNFYSDFFSEESTILIPLKSQRDIFNLTNSSFLNPILNNFKIENEEIRADMFFFFFKKNWIWDKILRYEYEAYDYLYNNTNKIDYLLYNIYILLFVYIFLNYSINIHSLIEILYYYISKIYFYFIYLYYWNPPEYITKQLNTFNFTKYIIYDIFDFLLNKNNNDLSFIKKNDYLFNKKYNIFNSFMDSIWGISNSKKTQYYFFKEWYLKKIFIITFKESINKWIFTFLLNINIYIKNNILFYNYLNLNNYIDLYKKKKFLFFNEKKNNILKFISLIYSKYYNKKNNIIYYLNKDFPYIENIINKYEKGSIKKDKFTSFTKLVENKRKKKAIAGTKFLLKKIEKKKFMNNTMIDKIFYYWNNVHKNDLTNAMDVDHFFKVSKKIYNYKDKDMKMLQLLHFLLNIEFFNKLNDSKKINFYINFIYSYIWLQDACNILNIDIDSNIITSIFKKQWLQYIFNIWNLDSNIITSFFKKKYKIYNITKTELPNLIEFTNAFIDFYKLHINIIKTINIDNFNISTKNWPLFNNYLFYKIYNWFSIILFDPLFFNNKKKKRKKKLLDDFEEIEIEEKDILKKKMYIKRKIFNNFKIKKKINDIINLNNLFKNEKKQDKKKINNLFKNINNINAPLKKENTLNINDFLFKIELEKEEDLDFFDNAYDLITSIKQINNMYDFLYFFRKEKEKKQFTKTEMIAHIENINTLFIDFILATKKNIKKDNSLSLIWAKNFFLTSYNILNRYIKIKNFNFYKNENILDRMYKLEKNRIKKKLFSQLKIFFVNKKNKIYTISEYINLINYLIDHNIVNIKIKNKDLNAFDKKKINIINKIKFFKTLKLYIKLKDKFLFNSVSILKLINIIKYLNKTKELDKLNKIIHNWDDQLIINWLLEFLNIKYRVFYNSYSNTIYNLKQKRDLEINEFNYLNNRIIVPIKNINKKKVTWADGIDELQDYKNYKKNLYNFYYKTNNKYSYLFHLTCLYDQLNKWNSFKILQIKNPLYNLFLKIDDKEVNKLQKYKTILTNYKTLNYIEKHELIHKVNKVYLYQHDFGFLGDSWVTFNRLKRHPLWSKYYTIINDLVNKLDKNSIIGKLFIEKFGLDPNILLDIPFNYFDEFERSIYQLLNVLTVWLDNYIWYSNEVPIPYASIGRLIGYKYTHDNKSKIRVRYNLLDFGYKYVDFEIDDIENLLYDENYSTTNAYPTFLIRSKYIDDTLIRSNAKRWAKMRDFYGHIHRNVKDPILVFDKKNRFVGVEFNENNPVIHRPTILRQFELDLHPVDTLITTNLRSFDPQFINSTLIKKIKESTFFKTSIKDLEKYKDYLNFHFDSLFPSWAKLFYVNVSNRFISIVKEFDKKHFDKLENEVKEKYCLEALVHLENELGRLIYNDYYYNIFLPQYATMYNYMNEEWIKPPLKRDEIFMDIKPFDPLYTQEQIWNEILDILIILAKINRKKSNDQYWKYKNMYNNGYLFTVNPYWFTDKTKANVDSNLVFENEIDTLLETRNLYRKKYDILDRTRFLLVNKKKYYSSRELDLYIKTLIYIYSNNLLNTYKNFILNNNKVSSVILPTKNKIITNAFNVNNIYSNTLEQVYLFKPIINSKWDIFTFNTNKNILEKILNKLYLYINKNINNPKFRWLMKQLINEKDLLFLNKKINKEGIYNLVQLISKKYFKYLNILNNKELFDFYEDAGFQINNMSIKDIQLILNYIAPEQNIFLKPERNEYWIEPLYTFFDNNNNKYIIWYKDLNYLIIEQFKQSTKGNWFIISLKSNYFKDKIFSLTKIIKAFLYTINEVNNSNNLFNNNDDINITYQYNVNDLLNYKYKKVILSNFINKFIIFIYLKIWKKYLNNINRKKLAVLLNWYWKLFNAHFLQKIVNTNILNINKSIFIFMKYLKYYVNIADLNFKTLGTLKQKENNLLKKLYYKHFSKVGIKYLNNLIHLMLSEKKNITNLNIWYVMFNYLLLYIKEKVIIKLNYSLLFKVFIEFMKYNNKKSLWHNLYNFYINQIQLLIKKKKNKEFFKISKFDNEKKKKLLLFNKNKIALALLIKKIIKFFIKLKTFKKIKLLKKIPVYIQKQYYNLLQKLIFINKKKEPYLFFINKISIFILNQQAKYFFFNTYKWSLQKYFLNTNTKKYKLISFLTTLKYYSKIAFIYKKQILKFITAESKKHKSMFRWLTLKFKSKLFRLYKHFYKKPNPVEVSWITNQFKAVCFNILIDKDIIKLKEANVKIFRQICIQLVSNMNIHIFNDLNEYYTALFDISKILLVPNTYISIIQKKIINLFNRYYHNKLIKFYNTFHALDIDILRLNNKINNSKTIIQKLNNINKHFIKFKIYLKMNKHLFYIRDRVSNVLSKWNKIRNIYIKRKTFTKKYFGRFISAFAQAKKIINEKKAYALTIKKKINLKYIKEEKRLNIELNPLNSLYINITKLLTSLNNNIFILASKKNNIIIKLSKLSKNNDIMNNFISQYIILNRIKHLFIKNIIKAIYLKNNHDYSLNKYNFKKSIYQTIYKKIIKKQFWKSVKKNILYKYFPEIENRKKILSERNIKNFDTEIQKKNIVFSKHKYIPAKENIRKNYLLILEFLKEHTPFVDFISKIHLTNLYFPKYRLSSFKKYEGIKYLLNHKIQNIFDNQIRFKNIFFFNQYINKEKTNFFIKKEIINLAYKKPEVIKTKIIKKIQHYKYTYPNIWKKNINSFNIISSKKNKFKKIKILEQQLIDNLFLYNDYITENTEFNINFDQKGFKEKNIYNINVEIPNYMNKYLKNMVDYQSEKINNNLKNIHIKSKNININKNDILLLNEKLKNSYLEKNNLFSTIWNHNFFKSPNINELRTGLYSFLIEDNNSFLFSNNINKDLIYLKNFMDFNIKLHKEHNINLDINFKHKIVNENEKIKDINDKYNIIKKIKDSNDKDTRIQKSVNLNNYKNINKKVEYAKNNYKINKNKKIKKEVEYDDDNDDYEKNQQDSNKILFKKKSLLLNNKIKRSSLKNYAINIDKYNTYIKEYINYYKFFNYDYKKKKVSDWNYEINNYFKYKINKYFKLPISYITNGSINYKNKNSFLNLKKIKHSKYLHNLNNEFIWKTQNLINDSLLIKKKIIKVYLSKYNNNNFYYKLNNLYIKKNPLILKDFFLNNYIDKKKNKNYFLKRNYFILKITWLWYEYLITKYPNKFFIINNTIIEFEKKIFFEKEYKEQLYINKKTNQVFNLLFPNINTNNIDLKKEYYKRLRKVIKYRFYLFSNDNYYNLNEEIFILKKKIELFESQFVIYKLDSNFIINYYNNINKNINRLTNIQYNYYEKKKLFNFKNINNKISNYNNFIFNYQDNWIRYSKDSREYWINKSIELLNNKNNIFFFKKNNIILYKFFYKIKYLYINYIIYFNIFNNKLKYYLNILIIYIKNFNINNTNKKLNYKNKILYKITDLEIEFKKLNKNKKYFFFKKKIYSLQFPKIVVSIKIPKIHIYLFNKKINYYSYINKIINYLFTFLKQIINFFSKPIKIKIFTYKYETQILKKSWFYRINKIYYKWRIYKIDVINKPFYFNFFEKFLFEKKYNIYSLFINKKHTYYFKWFSIDFEKIYIFLNNKLIYYIQYINYYCLVLFKYISKIIYMSNINYINLIYIQYILHYIILKINYIFIYIYLLLLKLIFYISLYPLIIFFIIYLIYKIYQYKYHIYLFIIYIIDYIQSKYNLFFNNKIINNKYNIYILNIFFFKKYINIIYNQVVKYLNKINTFYINIKNKFIYYINKFKNKWK